MKASQTENIMARSAVDYITCDFLDAYEEVGRLYQRTLDQKVKQACLRVRVSLDAGLDRLVRDGTHAADRWKETRQQFPN
jgi:hypothetical protein